MPSSIGQIVVAALREHADALRQGAIVTIAEGGMRA